MPGRDVLSTLEHVRNGTQRSEIVEYDKIFRF